MKFKRYLLITLTFIIISFLSSCGEIEDLNGTYTSQGGHTTYSITFSEYTKDSLSASWNTYTDISAPLKSAAGTSSSGEDDFVKISYCPYSTLESSNTIWYESDSYYLSIKNEATYTFTVFYKNVDGVACYVVADK